MRTTRVLLADDHPLILAALRVMLGQIEGVRVVAEATNGRDAIALAQAHHPDIAIVDISMSELNGIDAAARIKAESPSTRVLILSSHVTEEFVHRAVRAGVSGYISKGARAREIELAIDAVMEGKSYFGPDIATHLVASLVRATGAPGGSSLDRLTPRQREVLQLIAEGRRTKQIAHVLGTSVKTVENHRAEIMRRLGIDSVAGLALFGARHGLVKP
ncbi:MAG TPA: response regulator transcription factor [Usitatibacter sp.]|nr:response regulator transcription factor [Usitatibacter sp.]